MITKRIPAGEVVEGQWVKHPWSGVWYRVLRKQDMNVIQTVGTPQYTEGQARVIPTTPRVFFVLSPVYEHSDRPPTMSMNVTDEIEVAR